MLIVGALLSFLLTFLLVRHVHPGGILFYQGCAVAIFITVVQLVLLRVRQRARWSVALKDAMLTFLLAYSFLFTIPTTVDRSYSVKMLQHLAETPQGMSREEVGELYISDFVQRGGVDRRLVEQQATGTIIERDGRYVLTSEGEALATAFRITCVMFACQHSSQ